MVKFFLVFVIFSYNVFATHQAYFKDKLILNNEIGLLIIETDKVLKDFKVPKIFGLNWLRIQHVYQRKKLSNRYLINFSVDDVGKVNIPDFYLTYEDGSRDLLKSLSLQVIGNKELSDKITDHLFIKAFVNGTEQVKEKAYPGVPLALELRVYISQQLNNGSNISPKFQLDGLSSGESKLDESSEIIDGYRYRTISINTKITPFQLGEVGGIVKLEMAISQQSTSFFSSYKKKELEVQLPKIEVVSLPPIGKDFFPLGLIGEWQVETNLSKLQAKVGEIIEYKFTIIGEGDVHRLNTSLESLFYGFQLYELEKVVDNLSDGRKQIVLTLPMVITSTSNKILTKKLAIFNSTKLKYDYFNMVRNLKIVAQAKGDKFEELNEENATTTNADINKSELVKDVVVDKNGEQKKRRRFVFTKDLVFYLIIVSLLLIVIYFIIFNLGFSQKILAKKQVAKKRRKILKKLAKIVNEDKLTEFVRNELVDFLIDLYSLNQKVNKGLCAEEISEYCQNNKLRAFLYSSMRQFSGKDGLVIDKTELIKAIKKER